MVEEFSKMHQVQLDAEEDDEAAHASKHAAHSEHRSLFPLGMLSSTAEEQPEDDDATYTVSEAIDHMGFGAFQVLLLFYAGLAWAADAMEMMLLSFLGPAVRCDWGLSATQESLITSVVFLGTMLGANTWGALSDARGRRVGFQACSIFIFVFGMISAASPGYVWLLLARFLVGIGLGGVPVAFALFAEFCPVRGRGGWLIALQVFWTFGSMAEAAVAWGVLVRFGWRTLLALSALPFVLLMALYPLLPESAHFLAVNGRLLEAQDVLNRISNMNRRPLPPGQLVADGAGKQKDSAAQPADEEEGGGDASFKLSETATMPISNGSAASSSVGAAQARAQAEQADAGGGSSRAKEKLAAAVDALRPQTVKKRLLGCLSKVSDMLSQLVSPALRRTTLLLLFIWFANAISYYGLIHVSDSETACTPDGKPNLSDHAFKSIFITSTAELPGMLVAAVVIELFSRKRTLAAALVITAACTAALIATPAQVFLWGSRGGVMGAFAVLFIYTPEVYPTTVRSLGLGVANSFSRIGGLLSPFVAVVLVQAGHTHTAEALFAVFCLAAAVATMLLPIETKGRALQASAEPEQAIGMVSQLERESPQHSTAYQTDAADNGFSGAYGSVKPDGADGFIITPHSDSGSSAFSLGSASEDGDMPEERRDERPRASLLRPGAIHSDGPLAEDREALP